MKIVLLVDLEAVLPGDPQFEGRTKSSRTEMEAHVAAAVRALGHEAAVIPFGPDVLETMHALKGSGAGLVFNLTERFEGDRRKDLNVAALLELLHLPYTGTGPAGLWLCRDKAAGKRILGYHRIRVPRFAEVPPGRRKPAGCLRFPAIVKPMFEDGSDGISLSSVVRSASELEERVRMIHEGRNQPAICEEYVEGRELYIGVVGNQKRHAFPPWELLFGRAGEGGPPIATARVKWDPAYREKWNIRYQPAELDPATLRRISLFSRRVFELLKLRDYGRVDLRLTPGGEIVFIEANPNPDISRDAELPQAAALEGMEHAALIGHILNLALRRSPRPPESPRA
ncbi:MAG TPA: hypothetical protein P5567_15070 [Kiritimatiellia bacterium]|nr:hypothetical protein [Kiritimatiellia bacterium]HRZ13763.1 hypothetical protein [Kiritimatiellia bacterium]HSA19702.1 hypothetical protein [Kiritimatiellia bacterium]